MAEEVMQAEMVTPEQIDLAIDLLVTMVVDALAQDFHKAPNEVLLEFVNSKTGRLLYDASSGFWWNGVPYICEVYKTELENQKNI